MKRPPDNFDHQPERNLRPYLGDPSQNTGTPTSSHWGSINPELQRLQSFFNSLFKETYNKTSGQDIIKWRSELNGIKDGLNKINKNDIDAISKICFVILECFNNCDEQQTNQLIKWTSLNMGDVSNLYSGLIQEAIEIPDVYLTLIKNINKSVVFDLISKLQEIDLEIQLNRSLKNVRYLKNASNLKSAPKIRIIKDIPKVRNIDDIGFLKILMPQIPGARLLQMALVSKKMYEVYRSVIGHCNLEDLNIFIPNFINCMKGTYDFKNLTTIFIKKNKYFVPDEEQEINCLLTEHLEDLALKCENLKAVTFNEVILHHDVLKALCKLPKIEVLSFNHCSYVDGNHRKTRLDHLSLLSGMSTLKRIDFSQDTNKDEFPKIFSEFKRLFITYPDGSQYEGELKEGLFEGVGTLLSSDKSKRETGFFEKGILVSGTTTYFYRDGSSYEGQVYIEPSKPTFGLPYGKGKRIYPDGRIEEGLFRGVFLEGILTMISHDGCKYVVTYKEGDIMRKGTCYFPNGVKYEGEFKDLLFHGPMGIMTFLDGSRYEGPYFEGQRQGIGKIFYPDGSFEVAKFNRDVGVTSFFKSGTDNKPN